MYHFMVPFAMAVQTVCFILLFFMPFSKISRVLIHKGWIPAFYCTLYFMYIIYGIASGDRGFFITFEQVEQFFESKNFLVAGYLHFLAFDLFVASWIAKDSVRQKYKYLHVLPFIGMTGMLGPIGFIFYWVFSKIKGRQGEMLEEVAA